MFDGHDDLKLGFNVFLPPESKLKITIKSQSPAPVASPPVASPAPVPAQEQPAPEAATTTTTTTTTAATTTKEEAGKTTSTEDEAKPVKMDKEAVKARAETSGINFDQALSYVSRIKVCFILQFPLSFSKID